jgi:hypothetical protein
LVVFALCQSIFVSQSRCRCAYRSPARILHPAVESGNRVDWSVSLGAWLFFVFFSQLIGDCVVDLSSTVREPGVLLIFPPDSCLGLSLLRFALPSANLAARLFSYYLCLDPVFIFVTEFLACILHCRLDQA